MSDIPTLVQLPGGVARLRDPKDLTVRHTRPYQTILMAIGPENLARIIGSTAAKTAAESGENGTEQFVAMMSELQLDYRMAELITQMNDAVIWKWLESWTLKRPLPNSMLDVPAMLTEELYQALNLACSKREAEHRAATGEDPYSPNAATIDNHDSPSGASSE